jgi:hypothetical protein
LSGGLLDSVRSDVTFMQSGKAEATRWVRWLGLLGLLGYGIFLAIYYVPIAGGSDSSGYLNSARMLAHGQLTTEFRAIPGVTVKSTEHLMPLGFARDQARTARLFPSYPVGLPLQYAVAGRLTGWTFGIYLVSVGGAVAAVWVCFLCARELGVSPAGAWLGAAALAFSPMFLFIAIQPLSDVLATTWWAATMYAALRGARSVRWAVASGLLFGMTVLVRPTNLLLFPALCLLLGQWRSCLWAVLGGLPSALWLAYYQNHLYGAPWKSGYGNIFEIFRAENFAPTMVHYATWLLRLLALPLLLLMVASAWRWQEKARLLVALAVAALTPILFYAYYDVTKESWWCLRFILPSFPALILLGVLGLQTVQDAVARRWGPRWSYALLAALALWSGLQARHWSRKVTALGPSEGEQSYRFASQWAKANLPQGSVVMSWWISGAIYYYTDFYVMRFDTMSQADFNDYLATSKLAQHPLYAVLYTGEQEEAFKNHLSGPWEKIHAMEGVAVWKWVGQVSTTK